MGTAAQQGPYSVDSYSIDTLRQLLADEAKVPASVVRAKPHLVYFEGYFKDLGAKTILVERNYIDRDYLEDFASYYVRCFKDYPHVCSRLHFFDIAFSRADFEKILTGADSRDLSKSYLGFVVVKPLPETIVGRTCLRTYGDDGGRRHYPGVRDYEANVFGITLKAEHTLAFQEQDKVAAACATSALWSVFQGTGKLFQHPIPSPAAITKAATFHWPRDTRSLPNNGLKVTEMAHAIRDVGLEPQLVGAGRSDLLRGNAYAYLRAKVPLLLIVHLYDAPDRMVKFRTEIGYDGAYGYLGAHAVAVTGYSLGLPEPVALGSNGMLVKAARINKLYAHDDQVGPFARMEFVNAKIESEDGKTVQDAQILDTSWRNERDKQPTIVALPENLLIPLYHKIRIPYESVLRILMRFDALLEWMRSIKCSPLGSRIEWDIYLSTVNDFKTDIRNSSALCERCRRDILLQPMPKFLWCATGYADGRPRLGLVFDATDIEQGSIFVRAVEYDTDLAQVIGTFARALPSDFDALRRTTHDILRWFGSHSE